MFDLWRITKKAKEPQTVNLTEKISTKSIKNILGESNDVIVKDLYFNNKKLDIKLVGIDGLIDSDAIDNYVIRPLLLERDLVEAKNDKEAFELIDKGILFHISQESIEDMNDLMQKLLLGLTIVVFDSINRAIAFDAKSFPKRGIQAPDNESVLKGSKEAFIESIRANTALIRRKIKSPMLRFKNYVIGRETHTPVNVVYIKGVTDEDFVEEVKKRISKIDVKDLISAGTFECSMRDNKFSIFPQLLFTERVDKFCANLMDGKVGVLIDGLPIAYIFPGILPVFFQAPEDYAQNYGISSAIRILRYICALIALGLPAFYIAITTFHQEMIPTNLALSIIKSKQGVPFATAFEIIGMLIAFEILLEASLRLPKTIGATISILGGLIVGEAAVNAKFISPAVVVIIAIAGISSFTVPNQSLSNSIRVCRMFLVICASAAGLFGVSFGILIILYYLCGIDSVGIPYLTPFVSNEGKGLLDDSILRLPRDVLGGKNGKNA